MDAQEKAMSEAYHMGYEDALNAIKGAMKLKKMGFSDCEIVKRTDLPPIIIHAVLGDHDEDKTGTDD